MRRLPPFEKCTPAEAEVYLMRLHSERHPHWSESVDWRDGRWDPLTTAPTEGMVVLVRGRTEDGQLLEDMHYAYGGGDEQPPFCGWFVSSGSYFMECSPVEWQPKRAKPFSGEPV